MSIIEKNENTAEQTKITKRSILVYAIGIFAILTAVISLAFVAKDFSDAYKPGQNVLAQYTILIPMGIDLVFAALEITTGYTLIKQWKNGESLEIHKTIAKLIQVIVYESFATVIANELILYFTAHNEFKATVGMAYVAVYLVYSCIMMSMSTYVKKNEPMKLYWLMAISSFIAIGISANDTLSAFSESDIGNIGLCFANLLMTSLIFAFAVSTIIHYIKNPDTLRRDIALSEDSDIIKSTKTHDYYRVYSNRAVETKTNTAINILYFIAIAFGAVATVLFAIEQHIERYLASNFMDVFDNIKAEISSSNLAGMMGLFLLFFVLLIYPISYISAFFGIVRRDSRAKVIIITLVSIGTRMLLFANIAVIIDFLTEFLSTYTFSLEGISVINLVFIILYVAYTVIQRFQKNKVSDIFSGMEKGDSYRKHFKEIYSSVMLEGAFSVASLALIFINSMQGEALQLSYPLYTVSCALIMIATHLELKHPFSEYTTVKRRKYNENSM